MCVFAWLSPWRERFSCPAVEPYLPAALLICMKAPQQTPFDDADTDRGGTLAKPLAPEEIRVGDFVSLLHVFRDLPSFLWCHDAAMQRPETLVRLCLIPEAGGVPLKVKEICLPFVLVTHPTGGRRTLDVRRVRLARLSRRYAKVASKLARKDMRREDCR